MGILVHISPRLPYPAAPNFTNMSGEWQNGLFGRFNNCCVCLLTYVAPCYVHGKTAESVNESCLLCCLALFVPLLDIYAVASIRSKVRESKGIEGSLMGDLLATCCCPLCTIAQSANEMGSISSMGESMARE